MTDRQTTDDRQTERKQTDNRQTDKSNHSAPYDTFVGLITNNEEDMDMKVNGEKVEGERKINLKEIPTQNSKGNNMARCWKMREYDSAVCTDMRKSIKTTQEVQGSTSLRYISWG